MWFALDELSDPTGFWGEDRRAYLNVRSNRVLRLVLFAGVVVDHAVEGNAHATCVQWRIWIGVLARRLWWHAH